MTDSYYPQNEAVVILVDGNETMWEEFDDDIVVGNNFLGTTKLDVARYITHETILKTSTTTTKATASSSSSSSSSIHVVIIAVILLRMPRTHHHFYQEINPERNSLNKMMYDFFPANNFKSHDQLVEEREILFPNLIELPGKDIHLLLQAIQDYTVVRTINKSKKRKLGRADIDSTWTQNDQTAAAEAETSTTVTKGDFLNGLILATDTLYRKTITNITAATSMKRRILLLTDGKHKVNVDSKQLLVAMDSLKQIMSCKLEVIFFRDATTKGSSEHRKDTKNAQNVINEDAFNDGKDDRSNDKQEHFDEEDHVNDDVDCNSDDDSEEEDVEAIQDQNEALLRNLVEKLGGTMLVPRSMTDILDNIVVVGTSTCDNDSTVAPTIQENHDQFLAATPPSPRNESSLHPGIGLRIYWNGTDDVPLHEWLQRIRPSRFSKDVCAWIQVTYIDQKNPRFCQQLKDDEDSSADLDDDDDEPDERSLREYMAPLNKITRIIRNGGRVSKVAKDECVDEIMRLAKKHKITCGKWLIYVSPQVADDVWETVARATALGRLGCSSKIAPTANRQHESTVVCVYVRDSTDKVEVQRVLKTLYYDLDITNGLSNFKPDIYTYLEIYKNNPWRLKPTLYGWKDAMGWNLQGVN
jgi:hypothetical protein